MTGVLGIKKITVTLQLHCSNFLKSIRIRICSFITVVFADSITQIIMIITIIIIIIFCFLYFYGGYFQGRIFPGKAGFSLSGSQSKSSLDNLGV